MPKPHAQGNGASPAACWICLLVDITVQAGRIGRALSRRGSQYTAHRPGRAGGSVSPPRVPSGGSRAGALKERRALPI